MGRQPAHVVEVLDESRYARERPRQRSVGRGERAIEAVRHDRVDPGLHGLRPGDRRAHGLARGDPAGPDRLGRRHRVEPGELRRGGARRAARQQVGGGQGERAPQEFAATLHLAHAVALRIFRNASQLRARIPVCRCHHWPTPETPRETDRDRLSLPLDGRRARDVPRRGAPLRRERDRAERRALARAAPCGPRALEQGGRGRPALHRHPGRVWRRRRRCAPRGRRGRGDGPPRHHQLRPHGAQHPRALRAELRHRGAEARLAAAHGERRAGRRDRHDRARRRLRPAGRQDPRGARRRPLRDQRRQDVHLERPARRPRGRGGEDRSEPRRQGHLDHHGRDEGPAGLSRRPRARQDRPERLGHGRDVLRRLPRAGRWPARARRGPGLRAADARPAIRARAARARRRGRNGVRARSSPSTTRARARRSARRCSTCRTPASSSPT